MKTEPQINADERRYTMPKDAIIIHNVSKTFRIPHERKTTLFEHISGLFDGTKGYEEFEALKNINFTVKKGEAIGIIGENGSEERKTIVFVSHDMNSVRRFCKKAVLLRHGEQIAYGNSN